MTEIVERIAALMQEEIKAAFLDFCRKRDLRKPGGEDYRYREREAFALAVAPLMEGREPSEPAALYVVTLEDAAEFATRLEAWTDNPQAEGLRGALQWFLDSRARPTK